LVKQLILSNDVVKNHLRKLLRENRIISLKKGKARAFFPPVRK
jgi:hypothetical protein